jgi:hypothetical protein
MKFLLAFLLLLTTTTTASAQDDYSQSIARVLSSVQDLEEYCAYRKNDFCSQKQMQMSQLVLDQRLAKIQAEFEREQEKLRYAEKLRRLRRKNEMKMRAVLRERFMDRYF